MTKLVQITSPVFATILSQCHVGYRLGQVLKLCRLLDYISKTLDADFKLQRQIFQDASLPQNC